MEKREARRDRDYRYGRRTRDVHLRFVHPDGAVDCICERSAWFFRKGKSIGCRCRRKHKGNPKIIRGFCHGVTGYHPSVRERIAGRRCCRGWLKWVQFHDPNDFNDSVFRKRAE